MITKSMIDYKIEPGANLCEADLHGADLRGADLCWANLRGADLHGADLRWADLEEANLRGAKLRWADLEEANLRGANLCEADLHGADLRGANLRGANLRGANFGDGQICTIQPLFIYGQKWDVMISDKHIKIGCEVHTTDFWEKLTPENNLNEFDVDLWSRFIGPLIYLAKAHQLGSGK